MKTTILLAIFVLLLGFSPHKSYSQSDSFTAKHKSTKTIWDIPHKTIWQKWMWVHRSAAFEITKDRVVNYDTTFIESYYKRLIITIPISTRFLKFNLTDVKTGSKLTFAPNLTYNLGLGVSSRWATFIIQSGVKIVEGDQNIKGKTSFQDYQLNLYSRKFSTDMFVQYYSGFYIKNSDSYSSYISDKPYSVRNDVNALHMGVTSNYIVNNKKFSFGSSFAFTEHQKKSSGSILIGIYYSYFDANASPSFISYPFKLSFDTLSLIRNVQTHNFGLNLGYIYTLVFLKKCYATISLVQGFGGEQMRYIRDDNTFYNQLKGGAGKLQVRIATRYDNGRYFAGTMVMSDYYLFTGNSNSTFDYSFGKLMVFIGYRFSILKSERKILHDLKLTDY
jgi:hypothetical protein